MTAPTTTIYPATSEGLTAALSALGSTADEVAEILTVVGHTGQRDDEATCPIAWYLRAVIPTAEDVGSTAWRLTGTTRTLARTRARDDVSGRRHVCGDPTRCGRCIAEIAWRQSQPYNSPAWQGWHPLNPAPSSQSENPKHDGRRGWRGWRGWRRGAG